MISHENCQQKLIRIKKPTIAPDWASQDEIILIQIQSTSVKKTRRALESAKLGEFFDDLKEAKNRSRITSGQPTLHAENDARISFLIFSKGLAKEWAFSGEI